MIPLSPCDELGDVFRRAAKSEVRPDEMIERGRRITRLGELLLGESALLPSRLEPVGEADLHLDVGGIRRRKAEELLRRTDLPTCSFQSLLMSAVHTKRIGARVEQTQEKLIATYTPMTYSANALH